MTFGIGLIKEKTVTNKQTNKQATARERERESETNKQQQEREKETDRQTDNDRVFACRLNAVFLTDIKEFGFL